MLIIDKEFRHYKGFTLRISVYEHWSTKGDRKIVLAVKRKLPWPFSRLIPWAGKELRKTATLTAEERVKEAKESAVEEAKTVIDKGEVED